MTEREAIAGTAHRDEAAVDDNRARMLAFHVRFGDELRRFILGVVRDSARADDVVQSTLLKAVELGHTARPETYKSWVFQVAYREALVSQRREASGQRGRLRLAGLRPRETTAPGDALLRAESVQQVRAVLDQLPAEQRQVVQARIYDEKTFSEIAGELGLPLGTVLTRMRRALEKMKRSLGSEAGPDAQHNP